MGAPAITSLGGTAKTSADGGPATNVTACGPVVTSPTCAEAPFISARVLDHVACAAPLPSVGAGLETVLSLPVVAS
jgi:hypothetical protein